jgi:surfeit locus 1 family protein
LTVAGTVAVLFFVLFMALGTWQVERRVWKLDLIARVNQRVHAPPVAAPGPAQWPNITAASDEYRHVTAAGAFLDDSQTLVQAVTDLGAGYWVLTPLRLADGSIVLVNRGFVPADARERVQPGAMVSPAVAQPPVTVSPPEAMSPAAPTSSAPVAKVIGLLRMTEPRGGFLRHNDPVANRWYSRDVQAIAAARGLTHVAPYFIDAEAVPGDAQAAPAANELAVTPVPGLTVITFHNSHLVYAITWYTLALMVAIAIWLGIRRR